MLYGIGSIFDTTGFVPRWECGEWSLLHGWTHIIGDILIFLAYAAIPISLGIMAWRKGNQLPFGRVLWLFVAFIASCGLTHLVEAVLFYEPVYRLSAVMKVITATVSWATVFALLRVVPGVLALPELQKENAELRDNHDKNRERTQSLARTRKELEKRNLKFAQQRLITEQAYRSAQLAPWRYDPQSGALEFDADMLTQRLVNEGDLASDAQEVFRDQLRLRIKAFADEAVGKPGERLVAAAEIAIGPGLTLIGARDYPKAEDKRVSGVAIRL